MSFGQELQIERQRREISLESIAEGTKVPTRHLRALEQERFDQLPGGVFNKGIVRSYCRYVGLDEFEWLQRFPPAAIVEIEPDWASFAENVRRNRHNLSSRTGRQWLGVLLMLAVLGALSWGAWRLVLAPRLVTFPEASSLQVMSFGKARLSSSRAPGTARCDALHSAMRPIGRPIGRPGC